MKKMRNNLRYLLQHKLIIFDTNLNRFGKNLYPIVTNIIASLGILFILFMLLCKILRKSLLLQIIYIWTCTYKNIKSRKTDKVKF